MLCLELAKHVSGKGFGLFVDLRMMIRTKINQIVVMITSDLPLIMVAYSQATGTLYGGTNLAWYIGAVAWVLAAFALWRGVRVVTRGRLLGVADEQ